MMRRQGMSMEAFEWRTRPLASPLPLFLIRSTCCCCVGSFACFCFDPSFFLRRVYVTVKCDRQEGVDINGHFLRVLPPPVTVTGGNLHWLVVIAIMALEVFAFPMHACCATCQTLCVTRMFSLHTPGCCTSSINAKRML